MPTCIYCTQPTLAAEGDAHIFPEALAENDTVLPPGTVCTGCNQYLGHELDAALLDYPFIAFCVQYLGLRGKGGRQRERLGRVARLPDGTVSIEVERPRTIAGPAGPQMDISIGPDRNFNLPSFRRALHHVAFNLMAGVRGPVHALKPHFDAVRKYVRAPRSGESWPLVQVVESIEPIRPVVRGRLVTDAPGDTVLLQIFNCAFYVDLLNRGGLPVWADAQFDDPEVYIDELWKPDKRDKLDGRHKFRIRFRAE